MGWGRESTLYPLHATVAALMLALLDYPHKCWSSNFFPTIIYLINKRNHQKTHLTMYLYTSPDPVPESPTYPIT